MRHEVVTMAGFLDLSVGDVVGAVGSKAAIFGPAAGGWFALRVASQREDQAEAWLQRRGVYAFHPVVMRRTVIKGRVREYPRRYLPGYVFARFPGDPVIHRVLSCAFITGALALHTGEWGRIDPSDLQAIHAMRKVDETSEAARRAANRRRRQAVAFRPGDVAMFRGGPLAGVRCEVVSLPVSGGLSVRLSMFGGGVCASVSPADLVPIKPAAGKNV